MPLSDEIRRRMPDAFEAPDSRPGDILAEERELRARRRWWRPEIVTGRRLAVLFSLSVVMVAGFLFFRGGPDGVYTVAPFQEPPDAASAEPHPEAGRRLNGLETVQASFVGRPLWLGPGGLPVVEHEVTGEVREITPVEQEYWSETAGGDAPFLETGFNNVVWNPGPDGWGMWWEDNSEDIELLPDVYYDRSGWHVRQREELEYAALVLSAGLRKLEEFNLDIWREGPSAELAVIVRDLKDIHPVVRDYGQWAALPLQWTCSDQLEQEYSLQVTQGCPPEEYQRALKESWVRLGVVAERLEGASRLGMFMDTMDSKELYESTVVGDMVYLLLDTLEDVEKLVDSFDYLRVVTARQELPISVYLFRGV